jgi:hypothetical protein
MPNQDQPQNDGDGSDQPWAGISEIDQAIRKNRLTEYRWRKAWADPWGRKLNVFIFVLVTAVFGYLVAASFGWAQ